MDDKTVYIICLVLLIIFSSMVNQIKKWKEKAASAFFIVGQRAKTAEERKWGYRNALCAGNQKAERFYVYSALKDLLDEKPMKPFKIKLSNGNKVPVVFVDYYVSKRDWNFISGEQREFVQKVYDFKDGSESCYGLFKEAISKLELKEEVTIVFMPCSNQQKYFSRFSKLSKALSYVDGLHPILYSHTYLEERECRHKSKNRNKIQSDSNIAINADIVGKKVLLIDDVITTGNSIKEHAEELSKYGIKVIGAVCLAKTVQYPSSFEIWLTSHSAK